MHAGRRQLRRVSSRLRSARKRSAAAAIAATALHSDGGQRRDVEHKETEYGKVAAGQQLPVRDAGKLRRTKAARGAARPNAAQRFLQDPLIPRPCGWGSSWLRKVSATAQSSGPRRGLRSACWPKAARRNGPGQNRRQSPGADRARRASREVSGTKRLEIRAPVAKDGCCRLARPCPRASTPTLGRPQLLTLLSPGQSRPPPHHQQRSCSGLLSASWAARWPGGVPRSH